jgi:hypothetical protein
VSFYLSLDLDGCIAAAKKGGQRVAARKQEHEDTEAREEEEGQVEREA